MFEDRIDAGKQLARSLEPYVRENPLVLGLPRGGIPVAAGVADALHAPLDVLVVRKLGVPGHEELAMGAIGPGGVIWLNEDVIGMLGIGREAIDQAITEESRELERRQQRFRGQRHFPDLRGRTVILCDDGLATGATAMAAIRALRALLPGKVVLAVPVGSQQAISTLRPEVDELVCLVAPENFHAVSMWYEDFQQTRDEEVIDLLRQAWSPQAGGA